MAVSSKTQYCEVAMLKIGEFSRLSRVSIRMLRHYDEIGLLRPAQLDAQTGYRYYSEEQLPLVWRVAALRDMGFSLAAIREILRDGERETLERQLLLRRAELAALADETARRLRLLDAMLDRVRKDEDAMKYDVILKTFPERYAATVRGTLPCYEQEGLLWQTLMEETEGMNLVPDSPCICCAVFHDREHREENVDVEVQKSVKGRYPDTAHVRFCTIDPVTAATTVCRGGYEQMDGAVGSVAQWVRDNGYAFSGPGFFIYHVSPHETDNPDEYVTEICFPVEKRA